MLQEERMAVEMGNLIFKTSPYDSSRKENFRFSSTIRKIIGNLHDVITKGDGIYVFSAMRGVGKTSIKNLVIDKLKLSKCDIIINFPAYSNEIDFKVRILKKMKENINSHIQEIKQYIGNTEREILELKQNLLDINDSRVKNRMITILFKKDKENAKKILEERKNISKIERDLSVLEARKIEYKKKEDTFSHLLENAEGLIVRFSGEKIIELFNYEEYNVKSSIGLMASIGVEATYGILKAKAELKTDLDVNSQEFKSIKETIKKIDTPEKRQSDWEKLILEFTSFFRLVILIDEIDKLTHEDMEKIILENKKIFFDIGNTTILLVTDLSHGINLKCNLDEYVSGFIFHQTTSFDEWLIISRNLGLGRHETLEQALRAYSTSKGNYRKMVNNNIMTLDTDFLLHEEISLFLIEKHYFIRNSEKEYRDLLIEFFMSFVKLLQKVDEITIESSKEYLNGFLKKHRIFDVKSNLIFKKFLQVLEEPLVFHDVTFYNTNNELQHSIGYDLGKELKGLINELDYKIYDTDKGVFSFNELHKIRSKNYDDDKLNFLRDIDIFKKYMKICGFNLSKDKLYEFGSNYMRKIEIDDRQNGNHVDKVKYLIESRLNELVAIVFFEPFCLESNIEYRGKPLLNGYVIFENDFSEYSISTFVGYPGLTTNKPRELEELKKYLTDHEIPFLEMKNEDLPVNFWMNNNKNKDSSEIINNHIKRVMKHSEKKWIRALFNKYEPIYGTNIETVVKEAFKT